LDWAQFAVFFTDEEEWRRVRAFGRDYVAFSKVLFDEFRQGLSFSLGEGVDLPWQGRWGVWFEFDGVVPLTLPWEALRVFLAEHLGVPLVMRRDDEGWCRLALLGQLGSDGLSFVCRLHGCAMYAGDNLVYRFPRIAS
jgi:hypothetical protein